MLLALLLVALFIGPCIFLWQQPRFLLLPTLFFWVVVVLYLLNENFLGIHIFSATLGICVMYSLLGMVVTKPQWKALFLPFSLLMLLLPFEGYLDIYLGFPLRLLCADWAVDVLQSLGFVSMNSESIILIEENVANVDVGCSGIKGLWAGCIFYVLLSIIEGHRVSWRWLAIGAGFTSCLLMMNVLRIVLLVLLGLVEDMGDTAVLADLVHQSLGLLGFSLSCVAAWVALRLSRKQSELHMVEPERVTKHSVMFQGLFIGGLLLALWIHQPLRPSASPPSFSFQLSNSLQTSIVPLTTVEQDFFANNQASTRKMKFDFDGLGGSMLIVSSLYWKAQHTPRNCYISQGHGLGFEGTWLLTNGSAVSFLQVDGASKTAVYWFQSVDQVTPDYSARVVNGMLNPHDNWLMVSILWNKAVDKIQAEKLVLHIQASLAEQLSIWGYCWVSIFFPLAVLCSVNYGKECWICAG